MDEATHPLTHNIHPGGPPDRAAYEAAGGYRALRRALAGMAPHEVTEEVKEANLRGRGGAGFPAGIKWSSMPDPEANPGPRYLAVNGDEMEPGAFKDRLLIEGDPHQLVEGCILAAFAIQATEGYIFLRAAYRTAAQRLQRAIDEAQAAGYLGRNIHGSGFDFTLRIHSSAGRYLCGESSAMLNALEGRRALPRAKPPRSTTAGLWGRPTVVNNIETLCNVPHIVNHGAQWFLDLSHAAPGRHGKDGGTKIFGVSGRTRRTGAWELPMGTPLGEVLEEHAGGMREGYALRALLPGGASTGFLGAGHLDLPLDFDSVARAGSRLGTGTMILLDDRSCPVGMLRNMEHFFAQESCGWCTPCREGLPWTEKVLAALEAGEGRAEDIDLLRWHAGSIADGSFCAHAPGAMMPLATGLELFAEEFERHVAGGCPYHGGER